MLKQLFPIILLLFVATTGFSQTPHPVQTQSPLLSNQTESAACTGTQAAGTVSLGTFIGSSNDIDLNTMYLCFDDQVEIIHNGDFDLSGDPDGTTPGGIGYAFYECAPTVTGDELLTITTTDACLYQNPVFNAPPPQPIGPNNIWVAASPSNDITIINAGNLQDGFNGGAPVQFWFAPITYDNLVLGAIAEYEGVPSGSCVNANVNAAFSVVYLNAITESNIQTSLIDANGFTSTCEGSFDIIGGLPEFDAAEQYNISMSLVTDPSVTGTITSGVAFNNSTVEFSVVVPGEYNVVITDGKSCPANFTIDMSGCASIGMNVGDESGATGTQVCVPIVVNNFTDIQSFQYTMSWDPTIIDYAGVNYTNTNNIDLLVNQVGDELTLSFFALSSMSGSITVPDGTTFFEVCFNILGPIGSSSSVELNGNITIIDVFDVNGVALGLVANNGSVTVTNQINTGIGDVFDMTVSFEDVNCNGGMDGEFSLVVNGTGGGTPPYTLDWVEIGNGANNGSIGAIAAGGMVTQPGLPIGSYELTVTDSSNPALIGIDTIEIDQPPILGASISETQPILCFGDTNGSFTANVIVGGVVLNNPGPEYSFLWSPGNVMTQTINSVDPALGTYAVTITDGNGCTSVASTTPSQPAQLTVGTTAINAACSGVDNGSVTAIPNGGVAIIGYNYTWSTAPVQNTVMASGLGIGTYTVTVSDDNGCTATASDVVSAATIITSGATIQNVTCNGQDNGAIFFSPQVVGINNGGYTYQWDPVATSINSNASPIAPGTYSTTITDVLGCNIDTTIIITEPAPLVIVGDSVVTTDETCAVGNDGTAFVDVLGGTPSVIDGYTFNWTCCPLETSNPATGIPTGNYSVSVFDSLGCVTTEFFQINPPTPPTIVSFDSIPVPCPSSTNGELTVNATEGNTPIANYSWTFPNGSTSTGQTISNLGPGTYTVTVTSTDGCEAIDSATLYAPAPLTLVQPLPTNPTCYGESTGTASVEMSGGTTPYIYQWSANANNATITPVSFLPAGTYTVTVTDANFCDQVVTEVILEDPDSITIAFDMTTLTPVSCFDAVAPDCDGSVEVLVSGGNAPSLIYSFIWSSGEETMGMSGMASQLCQGTQTLTVLDENNCVNVATIDVPVQPALGLIPTLTPPLCNGDSNGSVSVMGMGGTPVYSYEWQDGTTGPILGSLPTGQYTVTITDMNGCEFENSYDLNEPTPLVATIDLANTFNVGCNGDNDGQITVVGNGGTPNPSDPQYNYTWTGGVSTSNVADGLSPGTYTVTVTDFNGCTDVIQHMITEPIEVLATIVTPDPPLCFGLQTLFVVETAVGGVGGPYQYSVDGGPWQDLGVTIPIFAGDHDIVVQDSIGCLFMETIFIDEPAPINVQLGPDVEIQLGESIQLNANTGILAVPIDSIIWTPAIFDSTCVIDCLTPTVSPLDNTLYTVEIFDENGCSGTDEILIEVDKNRNVFIPNVFTPNGDGYNDIFQVFSGPGVTQIKSIQVFDRWGELVFNANNLSPTPDLDYDNGWDGTLKGKILNPAVFVYLIEVEFDDGINLLFRGDLTLLH